MISSKNPSFSTILHRILVGDGERPTRFHDQRGHLVPLSGLLYAPHAFITTALRAFFGYRSQIPWFSYRAQRTIDRLISSDWSVLEFGTGMSTLWLAQRCGALYSIEHNLEWNQTVQTLVKKRNISNLRYFLRTEENYSDLSMFPDLSFDFILIDGIQRTACTQNSLRKIKPGGWIYLDDIDLLKIDGRRNGDFQQAEQVLLKAAHINNGFVQYFTDFAPTNFVVKLGVLVQPNPS